MFNAALFCSEAKTRPSRIATQDLDGGRSSKERGELQRIPDVLFSGFARFVTCSKWEVFAIKQENSTIYTTHFKGIPVPCFMSKGILSVHPSKVVQASSLFFLLFLFQILTSCLHSPLFFRPLTLSVQWMKDAIGMECTSWLEQKRFALFGSAQCHLLTQRLA